MGTIIQGYPKSKKNKSEKRNGRYSKKEVIPMEKHEQQKIVNRSIKEFTNKGDLITLDMLFKKDLEKKKKFEEYYAKNKDEVNNINSTQNFGTKCMIGEFSARLGLRNCDENVTKNIYQALKKISKNY